MIDHQSAGIFRIPALDCVQNVLMFAVGNGHFLPGQDVVVPQAEEKQIGLFLVSKHESRERRIASGISHPAVKLSSGTQSLVDVHIGHGAVSQIDRALDLPEMVCRGINRRASDELRFNELVGNKHVDEFFPAELPDYQTRARLMFNQTLVLEESECFTNRSPAHPQRRCNPALNEWFPRRDSPLKDCFLDCRKRQFPKAGTPLYADNVEDVFHIPPRVCIPSSGIRVPAGFVVLPIARLSPLNLSVYKYTATLFVRSDCRACAEGCLPVNHTHDERTGACGPTERAISSEMSG
jgi:hypothetical protein